MRKDYHKSGYWKEWYWGKGGRDKVQTRRKAAKDTSTIKKHIKFK